MKESAANEPLTTTLTSLRIDNSGCSVIYTFDHTSETPLVIITCDIPNKRGYLLIDVSL